jgi:ParB-like chromosome segregation protein Spo0J
MEIQNAYSLKLAVEDLALSQIAKNESNARQHSQKQIAKLAQSIRKFGFLTPVIVDGGNQLLCGHARVEAAQQAGMAAVPAIRIAHLSEAQKRAFVIADNRLAELASWDMALLKQELQFLTEFDIDFDFSAIGFETPELDVLLNDLTSADAKEDRLPPASSDQAPVSKPGSLWALRG